MTILQLSLNIKSIVKSKEMKKQNMFGETNSREKSPPEKSTIFDEIQRNFHDGENDNNEENQLIVTETNIIMKIIAYIIMVAILKTALTKAL